MPAPPVQNNNRTLIIVLAIVGGVLLLCIVVACVFLFLPLIFIGSQVNNIFSTITSAL